MLRTFTRIFIIIPFIVLLICFKFFGFNETINVVGTNIGDIGHALGMIWHVAAEHIHSG
jgi:hypothetical protein